MQKKNIPGLFPMIAAAALAASLAAPARAALFPPLNSPPTTDHRPGKLVWADLFTVDPDNASKFYCGVLGWTAAPINQKGRSYIVLSNGGTPVAGIVPRTTRSGSHPSRWIGYYAVTDMAGALAQVARDGGTVHAAAHDFPDRGRQAIAADKDGVPFGLLQSSSGDAPDNEPKPGEWNWFELYSRDPKDASAFYHDAVGFDMAPETHADRKSEFVISSVGQARGGIAPLPEDADAKPGWLGVIRVANLDKTLAQVPALGGEVLVAPHSVEFGSRFAIIMDPTGGTVGLVEYIESANPANNP